MRRASLLDSTSGLESVAGPGGQFCGGQLGRRASGCSNHTAGRRQDPHTACRRHTLNGVLLDGCPTLVKWSLHEQDAQYQLSYAWFQVSYLCFRSMFSQLLCKQGRGCLQCNVLKGLPYSIMQQWQLLVAIRDFGSSPLARSYLICMPRMLCVCMQPVLGMLRVLAAKGALLCQYVIHLFTLLSSPSYISTHTTTPNSARRSRAAGAGHVAGSGGGGRGARSVCGSWAARGARGACMRNCARRL